MTKNLYVLGHPVAHSKSPVMHNAAYRALGLPWEYGFADCPTADDARRFLAQDKGSWLALNITMPYKPYAFEVASWRSEAAKLAGGANVLVRRQGELLADNTDGWGCVSYLQREGVDFQGTRVIVCGTGPTSLALLHASVRAGASHVALLGRNGSRASGVLADYRMRASQVAADVDCEFQATSYDCAQDLIQEADVILDATPLGMKLGDPAPFDASLLVPGQTVFDVVYGHGETVLLAAARAAGCAAFDGAGMLVAQAVETVHDIVEWLDVSVSLDSVDLFAVMANAAGFDQV